MSGSPIDATDLRARCHPCSDPHCRAGEWAQCPFFDWVKAKDKYDRFGWKKYSVILQARDTTGASRATRSPQRNIIQESLDQKQQRLAELAPTIAAGAFVAFGVAESERVAQDIDFYLAKVVEAPKLAAQIFRVGTGRDG